MATDSLNKILSERIIELPGFFRSILTRDAEFKKQLDDIASYYALNETQRVALENEVVLVLMLFEPITQLRGNLMSELGISSAMADSIVSELQYSVFYGAVDDLSFIAQDPEFIGVRGVRSSTRGAGTHTPVPAVPPEAHGDTHQPQTPSVPTSHATPIPTPPPSQEVPPAQPGPVAIPKDEPAPERLELKPEGASWGTIEKIEKKDGPAPKKDGVRDLSSMLEKTHVPLAATRTMAQDIAAAQSASGVNNGTPLAPVPRYAKPYTGYADNETDSDHSEKKPAPIPTERKG